MTEDDAAPHGSSVADAVALNQQAFFRHAYMGNLAGVRKAVENGADVNAWHKQTGLRALHFAVGTNNLALVKYLLETAGAELVQDRSGRWPTLIAAQSYAGVELGDYIVEAEAKSLGLWSDQDLTNGD